MPKIPNKYGGGSQTNLNGLHFEQTTCLNDALINIGYIIKDNCVYKDDELVGISAPKNALYKKILEPNGIDFKKIISKKLLPDEAFYNIQNKTIYIIEKKFQNRDGSVDEKLQTCPFKKMQYQKLFSPIDIKVEYIYVLNNWFKNEKYSDVLDYIISNGCHYYYNEIPLSFLNL